MKMYLRNRLCIPIKGINRSIIYDLTRKDYYFIPNDLFSILKDDGIISKIENKHLLKFLLTNEIIFEVLEEELQLFPSYNLKYETPFDINCLVIEIDITLNNNLSTFLINNLTILVNRKIDNLNIKVKEILKFLEVESLNLVFIEKKFLEEDALRKLDLIPELSLISIFGCTDKIKTDCSFELNIVEEQFKSYSENVYPSKFSVNYDMFLESINYNTFYNKRVFIDSKGSLSNGNLLAYDKNLELFISDGRYLKLNMSSKDKTLVCNDCEFRRMCVDPRIPLYNEKIDYWYHIEECRYNPYISKWENEEGYLNLQDSGVQIKDGKIEINTFKLEQINKMLWE